MDETPPKTQALDIESVILQMESRLSLQIQQSEKRVTEHVDTKLNELKQQINDIKGRTQQSEINIAQNTILADSAKSIGEEARTELNDLANTVSFLSESNTELVEANKKRDARILELESVVSLQSVKMKVQAEKSENLANRGLRKTVAIRGIPQNTETEKTWDDTFHVAVKALVTATQIEKANIEKMIERIHRSSNKKDDNGNKERQRKKTHPKIFMKLYDWNDINVLVTALRDHGKESGIYIDMQYGPDTTYRRNLAMMERRSLLDSEKIVSGRVKFPAQLFVKYQKEAPNFVLYRDFSTEPVPDEASRSVDN